MGLGGVFTAMHALLGHGNHRGVMTTDSQKETNSGVLLLDVDGTLCAPCAPFSEIQSSIAANIYSFAQEELGWLCRWAICQIS